MINQELAQIFYRMAEFLEMKEDGFRAKAYQKVARFLESLDQDAAEMYRAKGLAGLKEIGGVGEGIAKAIEEFIKTGKIKSYQRLKKESPVDLDALTAIEGLGPKKIKRLYRELNIKNIRDLERAISRGRIRTLEGFGEKSEKNILLGIKFVKAGRGRFLLGKILPLAREVAQRVQDRKEVSRVSVAGSVRRRLETVGDIDILAVSTEPEKVMDFFTAMPEVVKIWSRGPTRSSVRLRIGIDCDLRVVPKESFGAALQYFTGSKDHNIATRKIAVRRGLKLNEYGLFRGEKRIAGKTEQGVYEGLGLSYVEPELRDNSGEVEAGLADRLPKIIGYGDILGETQCHSDWSDGAETIEETAKAAKKFGYRYLTITDHGGALRVAHSLDEARILKQMKEIDRVNKKIEGIKVLKGIEVDIKKDGRPAIREEILAKLDVVLASVHSNFKMSEKDMTARLRRAIENPHIDIIAHPTGRLIGQRAAYRFDFDAICRAAKKHRVALEINAHLNRLDLKDSLIRQAIGQGVKLTIGTDAHHPSHFAMMELGTAQARRGWARKQDILNTRSAEKFLSFFRK